MYKKFCYLFFFFIYTQSNFSIAHVDHYQNFEKLDYDLYRNDKFIGTHKFKFTKNNEDLIVDSVIEFKIEKFGVTLYKYYAKGTETYRDGQLIKFNSNTRQNNKDKFCNIYLNGSEYSIVGSSYTGAAPKEYLIGTWWNHSIVKAKAQISAISGRIIKQEVKFIGKEKITINNKNFNALRFNFSSTDKKLDKKKKLNTDVWYDEKSLIWIKASFDRMGKWEYRLKYSN